MLSSKKVYIIMHEFKFNTIITIIVTAVFICLAVCNSAVTWSMDPNLKNNLKRIKNVIKNYAVQKFELPETDILIEFPQLGARMHNVKSAGTIEVIPGKTSIRRGLQNIKCGVFEYGELKETFTINIRIRTFQDVVVSSERLQRKQMLAAGQLKISRLETTQISCKVFSNMERLIGFRTKRIIQAGEILTDKLVEIPPLIRHGSKIDLYFQKGALEIILPGMTRQDGNLGDKIRVKCLETNKIFTGRVVNAHTVVVDL